MTDRVQAPPDAPPGTAALQVAAMRGSWWTALQAMVALPVTFVVNIVVARSLGPHEYGTLATYTAAFALVTALANAGISDATLQWGAAAHATGERARLLDLARRVSGFHVVVETPLVVIAAVVLLHGESWRVQALGAAAVGVTMLAGTAVVVLTAASRTAPLARINLAVGLAAQLAVVVAATGTHGAGPTYVARLGLLALGPVIVLVSAPADVRAAVLRPVLPRRWPAGFVAFSANTLVAGLVTTLVFSRSEIFVLDAYGATAAAGLFALAAGLAGQITAPVDAMINPLLPAAAGLVAVDRSRAAGAVLRGLRLSGLLTAPLVALAVPAVAVLTPAIYGGRFTATGALFVALGVVSCLQSVLHPVTAFLTAWRRPGLLLAVNLACLVVDLGLAAALVPVWGAAGAVVGNALGQVVSMAASVVLLRRFAGLPLRDVVRAVAPFTAVATAGTLAAVAGILLRVPLGTVTAAALAVLAAGVVGALLLRRAVPAADLAGVDAAFPGRGPQLAAGLRRLGWVR